MSNEEIEYKSIEEVRSVFYPRGAAMLGMEKDEAVEFPATMGGEPLTVKESIAKRPRVSGGKHQEQGR